ncbi:MAG: hypothetical protein HMLKMBBP_02097 [Planctomycetes bacterium]|nr:hypothetical protein [Planctomycetota bacterium]
MKRTTLLASLAPLAVVAAAAADAVVSAAAGSGAFAPQAAAQDDPRKEARLLYLEGKFAEAEEFLAKADPALLKDVDLRLQLAAAAAKSIEKKKGEDRRKGLEAQMKCLGIVVEARPQDGAALANAIAAARDLAGMEMASRKNDAAKARADWAIKLAEKSGAEGMSADTQVALGQAYGLRAFVSRKPDKVDACVADWRKGAEMIAAAAPGSPHEAAWLQDAARMRFEEAVYVHNAIPIDQEVRDEEALRAALALAHQATGVKGATDEAHWFFLRVLLEAHAWNLPGPHPKPEMVRAKDAYEGIAIATPRGGNWKRLDATPEWGVIYERTYDLDPTDDVRPDTVQVMLTSFGANTAIGTGTYKDLKAAAGILFEKRRSTYEESMAEKQPQPFGDAKKGLDGWWMESGGRVLSLNRTQRNLDILWTSKSKGDKVFQIRVIDWRKPSSVHEPDIAAFIALCVGEGNWPPGQKPAEEPKGPVKPPKKK